ncbi:hypothetical protein XELAEV_18017604mg [Xenopus laevis]|uniref:Secreted protein n=1 Tax=Xenopus laevis TaxID=8355 RepID=A0A974DCM8_XENLA|nr:hypothetical protein XELAEV_18017604mg [Xenopus laevis]
MFGVFNLWFSTALPCHSQNPTHPVTAREMLVVVTRPATDGEPQFQDFVLHAKQFKTNCLSILGTNKQIFLGIPRNYFHVYRFLN